jgi:predicted GNAT family acetyltransferase
MHAREVDAAEFQRLAAPIWAADPVRHTVPQGVAAMLRNDPTRYPGHTLWVAEEDGAVQAAVLRTPPFGAIAMGEREGLELLAAAIAEAGREIPGANGMLPEADWFARAWCAKTGSSPATVRAMRLHALTELEQVPQPAGRCREATPDDLELLRAWAHAFAVEVGIEETNDQLDRQMADAVVRDRGAVLWDDGRAVSMSLARETSPGIARIGPVYTPPVARRRGYATALVAAHTEALLAAGMHTCLLFTDLANPTSNAIYGRIGYRAVGDAAEIAFS